MTSYKHLIISGVTIVISTIVLGSAIEDLELLLQSNFDMFSECKGETYERRSLMHDCTSKYYTEEEMNETMVLLNDTKLLQSKHFCRKQNEILQCIRDTADGLQSFSNKSEVMVPFVRSLVEESIYSLCDNDAKLLDVFLDAEQRECVVNIYHECRSSFGRAHDFSEVAICDYPMPNEEDPFTKKYICQKYLDFTECAEGKIENCSKELKKSVTSVIFKWRNETTCSKHL